jgi:hypothetical protein
VEVKAAKTSWVEKLVKGINDQSTGQGGSAECWQLVRKLRAGLERSVSRKTTMMRRSPTDKLSETAEENAEVFREFFEAQYSRKPSGNLSAADKLPQLPVFEEESRLPSRKEVRTAVRKLNLSGPGYTGNNAAAWKALLASERVFDWVEEYTCRFWQHQDPPADWETNLLKILEKKGDLSLPKNYRGIMMLEVAYKVVANIMQSRLTKIAETLPHESQCGFRPGRGGSDAKFNFLMALKKRREHGMDTWALLLDLVKAFDRVPRELLWAVMRKLGVPEKLVSLLVATQDSAGKV